MEREGKGGGEGWWRRKGGEWTGLTQTDAILPFVKIILGAFSPHRLLTILLSDLKWRSHVT